MGRPRYVKGVLVAVALCLGACAHRQVPPPAAEGAAGSAVPPGPSAAADGGGLKIAWYALMVHPYFEQVQKGVQAFAADTGIPVKMQIGQEPSQDNENANVEALAAQGYRGLVIFPGDASGANGLYEELTAKGCAVVSFGAPTTRPTTASFCVATDVKAAARQATEALIGCMGGKGRILDVLELVEDPNTVLRREGVEQAVDAHPGVSIGQTVAGMSSIEESTTKIQDALAANVDQIDGIICTGYTPTVAAATILSEWHQDPSHKRVRFIGIDTDETVLKAIADGRIDGTVAQNPYGHGYVGCQLVKLLLEGHRPNPDAYFVNAGTVLVTKDNLATYEAEVATITKQLLADLEAKCFLP